MSKGPAATVPCSIHVSALVLGLRSDGAAKSAFEELCGDLVACGDACECGGWEEHGKKREGDGSDAKKKGGMWTNQGFDRTSVLVAQA